MQSNIKIVLINMKNVLELVSAVSYNVMDDFGSVMGKVVYNIILRRILL